MCNSLNAVTVSLAAVGVFTFSFTAYSPCAISCRHCLCAQVRTCLAGRNVYIFGNSIARHWAFVLADWLSFYGSDDAYSPRAQAKAGNFIQGASNRTEEMHECGRGGPDARSIYHDGREHACVLHPKGANTTSIYYDQQQAVYSTELAAALREIARQASMIRRRRNDVIVVHAGSDDVFEKNKRQKWRDIQVTSAPRLRDLLWDVASGRVNSSPAGLDQQHIPPFVYWRTSTPVCCKQSKCGRFGASHDEINLALAESNPLLLGAICGEDSEHRIVQGTGPLFRGKGTVNILDTWAWSLDRCRYYDDHVHHSKLAYEHVYALLVDVCSGTGTGTVV